jgi:hypothetical protein
MRERRYIEPLVGVETLADSLDIRKNPLAAAGLAAVGGLATGIGSEATRIAQEKVEQATKDLQSSQKTDADRAKRAKTQEGQGAEIEGMNNSQSSSPSADVDEKVSAPTEDGLPTDIQLSLDKNWFLNNFGMTGSEMASLLIQKQELEALDALYPLLLAEKRAIISSFPGVSPHLVKQLPLTDVDYDRLNRYSERLGIPFRRFVKMWESANTSEAKNDSYNIWKSVVDADQRISNRERNILQQCSDLLIRKGALNAHTLKFNGVSASPAEISSLIKSHGFLYDIVSVGVVSKSVGRGLFYDIKRRDVILKDAPRFLAGLIESGSKVKFDVRSNPRIELNFKAPTAPWYSNALNKEIGVECVKPSTGGLIIEGEKGVLKALDMALPHITSENHEAFMLEKALRHDKNALTVMVHDSLDKKKQVKFLKSKKLSVSEFDLMKEEVMKSG